MAKIEHENYSIEMDVPGRSHIVKLDGKRVGMINSYEIPGSNVPTKANPEAKARFNKYSVSIDGKNQKGQHTIAYAAHEFKTPEDALQHFVDKHKELKEAVTTGPAISGTQSAEDDPSTPRAPKLFHKIAKRKAIEAIKEHLIEAKKIDIEALKHMTPPQQLNYINSVKEINANMPPKKKTTKTGSTAAPQASVAAPAAPNLPRKMSANLFAPASSPTPQKYIPPSFDTHINNFHATKDPSHLDKAESLARSEYDREKARIRNVGGPQGYENRRWNNNNFDTRMSTINALRGPSPNQKESKLRRIVDVLRGK